VFTRRPQFSIQLVCPQSPLIYLSKFIFISFHCKFNSQYTINGHTIKESSSCKDLGIVFINTLTWQEHYEIISAKAYQTLGLLRTVFKNCQNLENLFIYILLVRAKLLYCSPLWKPYLLKDIESLERVHGEPLNSFLSDYSSDYRTRLIKIGILLFMIFFIKSLKQPSDKFNILDFTTGITRSSGIKLYPKTASTNCIMNSYLLPSTPTMELFTYNTPISIIRCNQIKAKTFSMESFLNNFRQYPMSFPLPVPIAAGLLQQTIIVICNYSIFVYIV